MEVDARLHVVRCGPGTVPQAIPIAKFLEVARRPDKTVEGKILEVNINGVGFVPCPICYTFTNKQDAEAHAETHLTPKPKDPGPIATILEDKEDWDAMAELLDPLGVRWRRTGSTLRNGLEYSSKIKLIFNRQPGVMTFLWLTDKTNIPTVSHARFVQHVKKYLDYVARKP
jgi:hypothetical protein